jgi:hypothetical protein
MWDTKKPVQIRKFMSACIKIIRMIPNSNTSQGLRNMNKTNSKLVDKKKQYSSELKLMKWKRIIQRIHEANSWFSENINKTDKPLVKLTKRNF